MSVRSWRRSRRKPSRGSSSVLPRDPFDDEELVAPGGVGLADDPEGEHVGQDLEVQGGVDAVRLQDLGRDAVDLGDLHHLGVRVPHAGLLVRVGHLALLLPGRGLAAIDDALGDVGVLREVRAEQGLVAGVEVDLARAVDGQVPVETRRGALPLALVVEELVEAFAVHLREHQELLQDEHRATVRHPGRRHVAAHRALADPLRDGPGPGLGLAGAQLEVRVAAVLHQESLQSLAGLHLALGRPFHEHADVELRLLVEDVRRQGDAHVLLGAADELLLVPDVLPPVDVVLEDVVAEVGQHDLVLPVDRVLDLQLVGDVDRRAGLELDLHRELHREREEDQAEDHHEEEREAPLVGGGGGVHGVEPWTPQDTPPAYGRSTQTRSRSPSACR